MVQQNTFLSDFTQLFQGILTSAKAILTVIEDYPYVCSVKRDLNLIFPSSCLVRWNTCLEEDCMQITQSKMTAGKALFVHETVQQNTFLSNFTQLIHGKMTSAKAILTVTEDYPYVCFCKI